MKKIIYLLLFLIAIYSPSNAQVVQVQPLASGLLYPVCIQNSGIPADNRLFVVEKRGRIKIVNRNTGAVSPTPFLDIYSRVYPIASQNDERGLLGLAFHPDYASNGYFYVNYVNTSGKTVIARYKVSPFADTALTTSEQILMTVFQPYANHKGGNLMFGPDDGYLYISLGDGGSSGDPANRAQNRDSLLGKTLRIDVNNPAPPYYFSAPGNPFYGSTPGRDEIFDMGLRNPWRCSFDRLKHDMWIADVGQNIYEEIDFRAKCDTVGHNYGWRCYEGNNTYSATGCQPQSSYEAPVFVYTHSLGCSVTGGYVYRGAHEGSLFGKYLFTDYCQGRIWATSPNSSGGWTTSILPQNNTQINNNFSSFGEDVDGELYLAAVGNGQVYRLKDTACAPTAYIHAPDTVLTCASQVSFSAIYGNGLTYAWSVSGGTWSINAGQGSSAVSLVRDPNAAGILRVFVSNGTCTAVSDSIVLIPGVKMTGLDSMYCQFMPTVALTGFPAGGTFSGPGISGNVFNPATAGPGVHTISYSLSDTIPGCYYKASDCVLAGTRTVVVDVCAGLAEQSLLQNVRVYPNPGYSTFNLEYYAPAAAETNVTVNDGLGRSVYNKTFYAAAGSQQMQLELPGAAEGVYFLLLRSKQGVYATKLILRK